MSLDLYFLEPEKVSKTCIHCDSVYETEEEIENFNITHNLSKMAKEAGIYDCLWHPVSNGFIFAHQLVLPLEKGLVKLKENPSKYKIFSADNGWGTYEQFLPWIEKVLNFCKEYPNSIIKSSV